MSELYKRIKARREALGLSQEDLAVKLGYKSRSTIAKIESGENDIPQTKIAAFAIALNTTPAYLMGWDNDAGSIKAKDNTEPDEYLRVTRRAKEQGVSPESLMNLIDALADTASKKDK